ncbi:MAG: FAD-dependent oxidoreductase, partial [Mycobacteriales bacterium]
MSDIIVVGAGLIGLSCAWRARRRGARVTVLDDRPDRAASRTAAGMLAPLGELQYGEQTLLNLGLEAVRRYPDDVAELTDATGIDVGYRRCGAISVGLDNDDNRALGELFSYGSAQGPGMQRL